MSQNNNDMMQESLENLSNDQGGQTVIKDMTIADTALAKSQKNNLKTQELPCPYCGSKVKKEEAGDLTKCTCTGCRRELGIEGSDEVEQEFRFNAYANAVMNRIRSKKGWDDSEMKRVDDEIKSNMISWYDRPFFQMLEVARITKGFREMPKTAEEKDSIETSYKEACDFLKKHPDANMGKLSLLIKRYERMVRRFNKDSKEHLFKTLWLILASILLPLIVAFLILHFYTPKLSDTSSGISIHASNDSFALFDKLGMQMTVTECPEDSVSYINAKNALRYESEKFVLYDLSLTNKNKNVERRACNESSTHIFII